MEETAELEMKLRLKAERSVRGAAIAHPNWAFGGISPPHHLGLAPFLRRSTQKRSERNQICLAVVNFENESTPPISA
jgi:hypothetical protein